MYSSCHASNMTPLEKYTNSQSQWKTPKGTRESRMSPLIPLAAVPVCSLASGRYASYIFDLSYPSGRGIRVVGGFQTARTSGFGGSKHSWSSCVFPLAMMTPVSSRIFYYVAIHQIHEYDLPARIIEPGTLPSIDIRIRVKSRPLYPCPILWLLLLFLSTARRACCRKKNA